MPHPFTLNFFAPLIALQYVFPPADPQPSGWPLTPIERAYVVEKPEHERRPGREVNQHLPELWPSVPTAGHWGGTGWLDAHSKLVAEVQANPGPVDVLLVGDSITQQWGDARHQGGFNEAWTKFFAKYEAINIGLGGDKTQNVLWRLDHGAVDGITPRAIVLMIGNNNMFFTPETGVAAAAQGVKTCATNLRERFPDAHLIVVKILPCHAPGNRFYEDVLRTNHEIEKLRLDSQPNVTILDLTRDFLNDDATIKSILFSQDGIHLSAAGYLTYANRLQPLLTGVLEPK